MQETARIQALNDAFRSQLKVLGEVVISGDLMVTSGVSSQGTEFLNKAFKRVQEYTEFREDNDPYGEHDFGSFTLDGQKLFWKIDYYDQNLEYGSPDPTDQAITRRVLTILLASEY